MYKFIIIFSILFIGCSKTNTITYKKETINTDSIKEELIEDKLIIYTSFTENNEPIKMASCKGCHFVCPKCIE